MPLDRLSGSIEGDLVRSEYQRTFMDRRRSKAAEADLGTSATFVTAASRSCTSSVIAERIVVCKATVLHTREYRPD